MRDRQFGADDGTQPGLAGGFMEPGGAVDAVGVEQGDCGIAERGGALHERFGQRGAAKKTEGRCAMKFDVHGDWVAG